MNTFYFNTGVKYSDYPYILDGQVYKGGTKQIPFDCEAPETAKLLYLCDNPNLESSKNENIGVYPVFNTTMCSKYAYFLLS